MERGQWSPGFRRPPFLGPVIALGLLLAICYVTPALGQTPAERVIEFLDASSGFQLLDDVRGGTLQEGQRLAIPIMLVEGADYMVVAYCGAGCNNLDLFLVDESGDIVQADQLPDAEPALMFRADSTGTFQIIVEAVDLSEAAASLAVGVLGSTAEAGLVPGQDMSGRLALVGADFANLGFTEVGDERLGSLNTNQIITVPLTFQAGVEYRVVGVCDQDCFDLDLALRNPRGQEVTSDVLEDAIPILAHVADTTGEYGVEVIMVACALEPCAYRLSTFAKGAEIGPGGSTFSGELLFFETHRGELDSGDQEVDGSYLEDFEVEAKAGQRIIVDLRSDDFDTYLILTGPDGTSEENDDFGYDTGHSHIEMLVVTEGTYTVRVTSFESGSGGSFVLQVAVVE